MRFIVFGTWTWEEVVFALWETEALISKLDYPVNLVIDLSQSTGVPMSHITTATRLRRELNPNWSSTLIIVGDEEQYTIFTSTFKRLYANFTTMYRVSSLIDARDLLELDGSRAETS